MLRREDGFTLTEVLVALFLLSAVSAVFLPIMESSLRVTNSIEAAARTNDAARLALAQLDRDFRAAEKICEPQPGNSADRLSFHTRAYTSTTSASGVQEIVYELRDPDGDGSATDLQRSADGGAWRTVVGNVVNQDLGVKVFETEGGGASTFPSEGKVVIITLWVDTDADDILSPRLATTELSGRNIWTPNGPGC